MSENGGLASPGSMKLVVADLKASEAFYRRVCSFKPASTLRFSLAGRPFSEVILRDTQGEGSLILMAYDDGEAPSPGSAVMTFSTDDLEAFGKRVVEAGAKVIAEPRGLRLGKWSALIGEFADPDGNLLQVLQTVAEDT
jgi:predicted enzyme related to lactoylglutathione lyase